MHITALANNTLRIDNCIISYPHLFKAWAGKQGGSGTRDPKFSGNFILPADLDQQDNSLLMTVYQEAVNARWGNSPPATIKQPWKDGGTADPTLAGRLMITASSPQDRPPEVFIAGVLATAEQASQIFAGCIVNVVARCYAYTEGSNGVTFGLNGVMLVDNMDVKRLDGRVSSAAAFGLQPQSFPTPTAPVPNQPGPAVPPQQQVAPGVQPQPGPMPGVQQVAPQAPAPQPQQPSTPGQQFPWEQ